MFKPDGAFSDAVSWLPLASPGRRLPDSSKRCVSTIILHPPECMSIELTCPSLYIAFGSNHPVLSAREWHRTLFSICLYLCVLLRRGPLSTLHLEFEISWLSQEQRLPLAFSSTRACILWAVKRLVTFAVLTVMKLQMDWSLPECRKHKLPICDNHWS